jgi:hypothetical protein
LGEFDHEARITLHCGEVTDALTQTPGRACVIRRIPIADSGAFRSPIPAHSDRRFRPFRSPIPAIPIADSGHSDHGFGSWWSAATQA